jgi:hypothetical protein
MWNKLITDVTEVDASDIWMSEWVSVVVCVKVNSETHTKPLLVTGREEGIEVNVEITGYVFMS